MSVDKEQNSALTTVVSQANLEGFAHRECLTNDRVKEPLPVAPPTPRHVMVSEEAPQSPLLNERPFELEHLVVAVDRLLRTVLPQFLDVTKEPELVTLLVVPAESGAVGRLAGLKSSAPSPAPR